MCGKPLIPLREVPETLPFLVPQTAVNMTTVQRVNQLVGQLQPVKRQATPTEIDHAPALFPVGASRTARLEVTPPAIPPVDYLAQPTLPPTKPRFPEGHPIHQELFELQNAASVIHFSALGKPWTVTEDTVRQQRPDAHPLLSEQFRTWRETAAMVCPAVTS